ncbi:hydroxyacid dehydrogenase [bacterium]|nr:hydroxyacid dehydrogenase [bacterium]
MKYKILSTIGSVYTPAAKEILEKIGTVDCLDLNQTELDKKIKDYDIVVVGLGLNFHKETLEQATNLKAIATATTGLDHIDVNYAQSKNIKVLSLREETEFLNTITGTAELALGLMIDILRQTHPAVESVNNYQWDRENFRGHNLYGQTLGLVGLGRLGSWMAKYGNAAGMKVLAYDPNVEDSQFKKFKASKVDFDILLAESDVVSIHVHLAEDTTDMFDKNAFEKMKDSAYLINTARGKIVNETDVLEALKNKTIAGYATDVLADELDFASDFSKHPLVEYARQHNNLLIVPHIGGMTYESRQATDVFIAEKVIENFK